jgi:hypothetical protein
MLSQAFRFTCATCQTNRLEKLARDARQCTTNTGDAAMASDDDSSSSENEWSVREQAKPPAELKELAGFTVRNGKYYRNNEDDDGNNTVAGVERAMREQLQLQPSPGVFSALMAREMGASTSRRVRRHNAAVQQSDATSSSPPPQRAATAAASASSVRLQRDVVTARICTGKIGDDEYLPSLVRATLGGPPPVLPPVRALAYDKASRRVDVVCGDDLMSWNLGEAARRRCVSNANAAAFGGRDGGTLTTPLLSTEESASMHHNWRVWNRLSAGEETTALLRVCRGAVCVKTTLSAQAQVLAWRDGVVNAAHGDDADVTPVVARYDAADVNGPPHTHSLCRTVACRQVLTHTVVPPTRRGGNRGGGGGGGGGSGDGVSVFHAQAHPSLIAAVDVQSAAAPLISLATSHGVVLLNMLTERQISVNDGGARGSHSLFHQWTSQGTCLLSGSRDGRVRTFDLRLSSRGGAASTSAASTSFASSSWAATAASKSHVLIAASQGASHTPSSITWMHLLRRDENFLLTASMDGAVQLWDRRVLRPLNADAADAAATARRQERKRRHDGRRKRRGGGAIAAAAAAAAARYAAHVPLHTLHGHSNAYSRLRGCVDDDEERVWMCGDDGVVRCWDILTGRLLARSTPPPPPNSSAMTSSQPCHLLFLPSPPPPLDGGAAVLCGTTHGTYAWRL